MGLPRVLLLLTEFPSWLFARSWSYSVQLGLEEGFAGNGVPCTTIVSPFQSRVPRLFSPGQLDQVWVEIVHNRALCPQWLEWLRGVAPVRVGLIAESLSYSANVYTRYPHLADRKQIVWSRLPYFTHVLALDEADVPDIAAHFPVQVMWWPQAVPRRWVEEWHTRPTLPFAAFCGTPYGERRRWLRHPALGRRLRQQQAPESGTAYPLLFDALYRTMQLPALLAPERGAVLAHAVFLRCLRRLRRSCYRLWMKSLRSASAVVNLPHLVGAYPSRVFDAMAAGRPVISWEVPERPRTRELFEDGKEILLYRRDDRGALAECIQRVLGDQAFARQLVAQARKKVLAYHTMEVRICQVLGWIETGTEPEYW